MRRVDSENPADERSAPIRSIKDMLDKILFWVVLVWMVAMLVLAFLAVREVWREASQPETDDDSAAPTPPQEPKRPAVSDPP